MLACPESCADVTAACVLHRFRKAELFAFTPALDGLVPWIERVMAFDRHQAGA